MSFQLAEGVQVTIQENQKFQTNLVSCHFLGDFNKANATEMVLLSRILLHGCLAYLQSDQLSQALADRYGANLQIQSAPLGQWQQLEATLAFVQPDQEQENLKSCLQLLGQVLQQSLLLNDHLGKSAFTIEKQALASELRDNQSDHEFQAYQLTKAAFFKQESALASLGQAVIGDLQDLNAITFARIKQLYQQIMSTWRLEITVVTSTPASLWPSLLAQYLPFKGRKVMPLGSAFVNFAHTTDQVQAIQQDFVGQQSRLCLAYKLPTPITLKQRDNLRLLAYLLGQNEQALLFTEIREKRGWVYDIQASFNPFFGWFLIEAGLDATYLTELPDLISEQFKYLENGQLPNSWLNTQKTGFKAQHLLASDSAVWLNQRLLQRSLWPKQRRTESDVIQAIDAILPADLSAAVASLQLTVATMLRGKQVTHG